MLAVVVCAGVVTVEAPPALAAGPTITAVSPASGTIGTTVTITGTGFTGASKVTFNAAASPFTVTSSTQITATVPAAASTGPIAVTAPGGTGTKHRQVHRHPRPRALPREQLAQASPDLLRSMVQTFAEALMGAEAEAVCGAGVSSQIHRRVQAQPRSRFLAVAGGWLSLGAVRGFRLVSGADDLLRHRVDVAQDCIPA